MGQFKDPNVISLHGVIVKSKFCGTVVVVISMASASQYDSRRHSNMAQTRPNFFHIDSLTSFC